MQYFKLQTKTISPTEIEYGWVNSRDKVSGYCIHCLNHDTNEENLSSVNDHIRYFNYYTGLAPNQFIDKFIFSNPDLLEKYWKDNYPNKKPDQHLFFLNIAKLIVSGESFTQYNHTYSKTYI